MPTKIGGSERFFGGFQPCVYTEGRNRHRYSLDEAEWILTDWREKMGRGYDQYHWIGILHIYSWTTVGRSVCGFRIDSDLSATDCGR